MIFPSSTLGRVQIHFLQVKILLLLFGDVKYIPIPLLNSDKRYQFNDKAFFYFRLP